MRARLFHTRPFRFAIVLAAWIAAISPAGGAPQQSTEQALKEKLSRTGIYFRADAPYVLRNSDDRFLPVYLEIINGVEKAGHSTAHRLTELFTRDSIQLEGINFYVKPSGLKRRFASDPLLLGASKDFSFDARANQKPTAIPDRMKKTLEIPLSAIEAYLKSHYVTGPYDRIDLEANFHVVGWPDQNFFLRVRLNQPPMPQIPHWYRGDVHYHSAYTDNAAERGNPLSMTKQAALDAGFNWMVITDHSTDLDEAGYARELQEIRALRDGRFVFIRGQELTLTSGKQDGVSTVHMVALPSPDDPDIGFPGPSGTSGVTIVTGDGSPGSEATPLRDALARVAASGGFAYAAHPFDPISPLLRGGSWDLALDFLAAGGKQLQAGLVGLEAWNRATTATADEARDPYCVRMDADPTACFQPDKDADQYARLEKGIELGWRPLLLNGLKSQGTTGDAPPFKVFLAAGSDAHGDFNFEASMDVLDFLSKPMRGLSGYAEDNAMGKLSTVAYCPSGMGPRGENVLRALHEGHSVMSNGPLLIAGFDVNANGSLDDPGDIGLGQQISSAAQALPPFQVEWASSAEFGPVKTLRLIVGSASEESPPVELSVPAQKGLASDGLYPLDLRSYLGKLGEGWGYIRLETRTLNGAGEEFRCYTNPIWIRITGP